LVHADLAVPSSPGLGGGEHSTTTAHVSEGTLASTVSTATRYTRNTRDGATSTPRFGRRLVSGVFRDSVGLSLVLGHASVDVVDNVRTDGSSQNCSESDVLVNLSVARSVDANEWSAGHDRR
jgi:hypothetical protein